MGNQPSSHNHQQQHQQQQQQQGKGSGEGPFVYSSERVGWNHYNSTTTNDALRYEYERGDSQPQQGYFEQQSKPQRDPRLYPQNYWIGVRHHHHQIKQTIPHEDKPSKEMFPTLRVLGKGSFGKVVLVQKRSGMTDVGSLFALKILRKQHLLKRRQVERLKTERAVLTLANNHPFIMKLHFAFQTSDKLFFVLDYCPGGELFFHLSRFRRFPERVARFYAAEVLLAIGHLHSCRIVYRDLKPENILLDAKGHVKLGDFGLAKENIIEPCRGANSLCGTPEYMAPEVIRQSGHGLVVDYWGLGMVIYEMITGLPPWYTTDRAKLFKRIKRAPLDIPNYFSNEASAMISSLLERNPYHRLGAVNGVADVMSHPFFYGTDWKETYNRELLPPIRPCEGWNPNGIFISNDGQLHATKPVHENDLDEMVSNFDEEITRGAIESRGHEDFQNQLSDSGLSDEEQLIIKKYPGFSYHKDEHRLLHPAGKYRQRPTQLHYATTRQAREAQQRNTLGYHHPGNAYSHYTQPQQPQAFMNHPSTYIPSQEQSYDQQRYSDYPNQSHQVYDQEAANINEQGTQTSVNLLKSKPDVKETRQVNTHHFRSKSLPARTFQTNLLISETANLALDDEEVREWDEKWDKDGTSENELHWDGNDTENDCLAGESIIPTNAADDEHVVNVKPPSANSSTTKLLNPPSNSNKISNPLLMKKNSIAAFGVNAAEHPIKLCFESKNEVTSLVRSQLSRGSSSIHSSDESNCSKASVLGRDMGDANFPSRS